MRKAGSDTPNSWTSDSAPRSPGFIRAVSPPTSDRGTAFFMHQYSFSGNAASNLNKSRGLHEYLPNLLRDEPGNGPLKAIVAAAGLAALSSTGNAKTWAAESYRLYNQAIRQLQHALSGSLTACSDGTLAAMMLMSTFEVRWPLYRWVSDFEMSLLILDLQGHRFGRSGLYEVLLGPYDRCRSLHRAARTSTVPWRCATQNVSRIEAHHCKTPPNNTRW